MRNDKKVNGSMVKKRYEDILNRIYKEIKSNPAGDILEIGENSKWLSNKLRGQGHNIYKISLVEDLLVGRKDFEIRLNKKFDYIILSYSYNNLDYIEKIFLIEKLMYLLNYKGTILIGDNLNSKSISLEGNQCIRDFNLWDDQIVHSVYRDLHDNFTSMHMSYEQLSECGGVIKIERDYEEKTVTFKELYQIAYNLSNPTRISKKFIGKETATVLLTAEENIYTGISLRNKSFAYFCSEKLALLNMISKGETHIKKIIVVDKNKNIKGLCKESIEMIVDINEKNLEAKLAINKNKFIEIKDLL